MNNNVLHLKIEDLYCDGHSLALTTWSVLTKHPLTKTKFQVKVSGAELKKVKVITIAMYDRLWQKEQEKSFLVGSCQYYGNGTLNFQAPKSVGKHHFVAYLDGKIISSSSYQNTVDVFFTESKEQNNDSSL